VCIDAGLVSKKVLVNSECSFNGAMGHDLGLDGSLSGNTVMALAFDLRASGLSVVALGSTLLRATGGFGSVNVVVARGQGVGVICLGCKTAKKVLDRGKAIAE
jgi:hypothetical protein